MGCLDIGGTAVYANVRTLEPTSAVLSTEGGLAPADPLRAPGAARSDPVRAGTGGQLPCQSSYRAPGAQRAGARGAALSPARQGHLCLRTAYPADIERTGQF